MFVTVQQTDFVILTGSTHSFLSHQVVIGWKVYKITQFVKLFLISSNFVQINRFMFVSIGNPTSINRLGEEFIVSVVIIIVLLSIVSILFTKGMLSQTGEQYAAAE